MIEFIVMVSEFTLSSIGTFKVNFLPGNMRRDFGLLQKLIRLSLRRERLRIRR
jgi:hypothetical protein